MSHIASDGATAQALLDKNALRPGRPSLISPSDSGQRNTVAELQWLIDHGYRAGAIHADVPLRFKTWSAKGEGRSAAKHYRTETLERLKALPIDKLAANDSALFFWTLRWAENWADEIVKAWGFRHVSRAFTWAKTNRVGPGWHVGMGYGTRAGPEVC